MNFPAITELTARPICSSACVVSWKYPGDGHDGFEIARQAMFEEDRGITDDDFWSLYSYPDFAWDGDTLHVIYSRKFKELYHQALTKDWLLGMR